MSGGLKPYKVDRQVEKLKKDLLKHGLGHYAIDLLIARIVDGQKLKDIVKEQGWTSIGSANHHLQQAIKTLRKGKL